jgi:hypothetical protein
MPRPHAGRDDPRELDPNFRCRGLRRASSQPPSYGPERVGTRVVHSPDVTPLNPRDIDWAEVAARARADIGDEQIARFSDRLRKAMNVTADTFRQGAIYHRDTEGLRLGDPVQGA